jgi:hypothetical protein
VASWRAGTAAVALLSSVADRAAIITVPGRQIPKHDEGIQGELGGFICSSFSG